MPRGIRFYVSKVNNKLNGKPSDWETITPYLCVNPLYKVQIAEGFRGKVKLLCDSGAFQDVRGVRLSYDDALRRQLMYENRLDCGMFHRIVSYDHLVDEQLDENGKQIKRRVTEEEGWRYVRDTIDAAEYLDSQRWRLHERQLVLSCQGTTVEQYVSCAESVLAFARPGDCFGMGGFCIVGKNKSLQPQFYEISRRVLPMVVKAGLSDVHLFGVTASNVLREWLTISRGLPLNLSTDSSSMEVNSVMGKIYDEGVWRKTYEKHQKMVDYHPRDLAASNIRNAVSFLDRGLPTSLPDWLMPLRGA